MQEFFSRQLVQMMGDDIKVKSTPGKGSVFWFDLDLPRICQLDETVSTEKTRKVVGFKGDKRKVLVIDDKLSNRSVLVKMLEPLGFEVWEATDGLDGLVKAQDIQPDCILMDLMLPVMDGFETTRRIRISPKLTNVVVIAISASVFDYDQRWSQEVGCDDFLPKPVQEAALLEKLGVHLGLKWVYESGTVAQVDDTLGRELTAPILPSPTEEMAVFLDLGLMGDIKGILEQTARIEALDRRWTPFARHLRQLAKSYKEKQILEFVKKYSGA